MRTPSARLPVLRLPGLKVPRLKGPRRRKGESKEAYAERLWQNAVEIAKQHPDSRTAPLILKMDAERKRQ